MVIKIALDAGHGLKTAGKRCHKKLDPNQTREWVLNSRIATLMENELLGYDVEVLRVDDKTGAKDISTSKRAKAANEFGADIYVSLHHNAANRLFNGGGTVVYVWRKADAELLGFQKVFYDNLIAETGLKGNRSEPLGKANFDVLVKTKMPALLIEHAFMDSRVDVPILLTERFAEQCARANVKSLVKILNLKKKVVEKPVVKPAFAPYRVKVFNPPLNIRSGPGTNYPIVGKIEKEGVYTIIEEAKGNTTYYWGKLKSQVGFISLSPSYVKKL